MVFWRERRLIMTLQQIQYFVTVCRYRNFTKAAEQLMISQPGISTAIRELEKECGVRLIDRRRNNIDITEDGLAFLPEAEKLLAQYQELSKTAGALAAGRGYLRVGIAPMGGNVVYPRLLREFLAMHPEIAVDTSEDSDGDLFRMLDENTIDLALTVTRSLPDETYHYRAIRTSRFMACVNKKNPLAELKKLTVEDLAGQPLVMLTDHYSQTRYLKRIFASHRVIPHVIFHTGQVVSVLNFIRADAAIGFLPEEYLEQYTDIKGYLLPDITPATMCIVWKRGKHQPKAVQKFLSFLKEFKKEGS